MTHAQRSCDRSGEQARDYSSDTSASHRTPRFRSAHASTSTIAKWNPPSSHTMVGQTVREKRGTTCAKPGVSTWAVDVENNELRLSAVLTIPRRDHVRSRFRPSSRPKVVTTTRLSKSCEAGLSGQLAPGWGSDPGHQNRRSPSTSPLGLASATSRLRSASRELLPGRVSLQWSQLAHASWPALAHRAPHRMSPTQSLGTTATVSLPTPP